MWLVMLMLVRHRCARWGLPAGYHPWPPSGVKALGVPSGCPGPLDPAVVQSVVSMRASTRALARAKSARLRMPSANIYQPVQPVLVDLQGVQQLPLGLVLPGRRGQRRGKRRPAELAQDPLRNQLLDRLSETADLAVAAEVRARRAHDSAAPVLARADDLLLAAAAAD